jgi:type IV secretory pathway VirB2 component (pilin)
VSAVETGTDIIRGVKTMKSVIKRAVAISRRGIINAAANIGSATIIHQRDICKAATSIMLLSLVIIAVGDTALAQTGDINTAASNLKGGFTKLLTVIFGPIRWILSVVGILIGLWHIFAGVKPDSKRTGTVVILGVLAYAFAPTLVTFVLSIAGDQNFNSSQTDSQIKVDGQ